MTLPSGEPPFVPYRPERVTAEATVARSRAFLESMRRRRTVRTFSRDPVPRETIENVLEVANTAPSGAHKQPWSFVAISDPALKSRLREAAEAEERRFYEEAAPEEWLRDLWPLGTDWVKTHVTDAPWVIVVFAQDWAARPDGSKGKHYYVNESVGIAVGFLIAAIHEAGLATLTHTPSPMRWLARELGRPANERAYLLMPVGFPAPAARVPDLKRKTIAENATWL